ncbi:MAG: 30S ribosomal protein S16 [Lentisphaeria bacterium]
MSVKIRLRRTGTRNAACHRIVVADSRCPRDGRFIEIIGMYDPRHKTEKIDLERVDYWIPRGAQPSETVSAIIKRARTGKSFGAEKLAAAAEKAAAEKAAAEKAAAEKAAAEKAAAEKAAEEETIAAAEKAVESNEAKAADDEAAVAVDHAEKVAPKSAE